MTRTTLPTLELAGAGQSPWLDTISRDLLKSGKMRQFIEAQGVMGVTSNPSIFEKAIGQGTSYDAQIRRLLKKGASIFEIYDALTVEDIQKTCDLFLPLFKKSKGEHGFVSLEVSPDLAFQEEETVLEAKRLFKVVGRPNVMIKIPATSEGIRAVRTVIGSGISVNVTLMFSLKHYQDVAQAYINGLDDYEKKGGDVSQVYSVASVFVSRIDTLLDKKLEALAANNPALGELKGKAAVANSKMIYQEFLKVFGAAKFKKLCIAGAHTQKVLWGSTSVKNSAYSDLLYVENLVGKDTVNTMPLNTLESLLDHGIVRRATVEENIPESRQVIARLKEIGFDLLQVGEQLQKEGVKSFLDSFDQLMKTLEWKREKYVKANSKSSAKPYFYIDSRTEKKALDACQELQQRNFLSRFLSGDPGLWKAEAAHQASIKNRLGWVKAADWLTGKLYEIDRFCQEVRREKIKDIVLLGMGGSSLAPEVMSLICKRKAAGVRFFMLDTTDPSTILAVSKKLRLKKSLFIVASKSGSTIETVSQFQYFYHQIQKHYGKKASASVIGRHFIAITDSGSSLEKLAAEKKFRRTFINPSDIGGRFSALSYFGMLPAALTGIAIRPLIQSARAFGQAFQNQTELAKNPAVFLGVLLAQWAAEGKDKATFLASKELLPFGAWLEQLIAESTGKEGKGIVFVDSEIPAQNLEEYGKDRIFVAAKIKGSKDAGFQKTLQALKKAGFPILLIEWDSANSLGEEFLKWELVTSVAGIVSQINPFDEPNVKESKDNTALLLNELKKKGRFENPADYYAFCDPIDWVDYFSRLKPAGYIALLAYVERSPQMIGLFNRLRQKLRATYKVPVLLGFGPRYLHSIGQLYKGGPKSGLFVAFLKQESKEVPVPGAFYSFGQLKKAQALGDIQAISSKGLPVLTVDLGKNVISSLKALEKKIPC